MLNLNKISKILPAVVLSAAATLSVPAHADGLDVLTAIASAFAKLFSPQPPIETTPVPMTQPPVRQYGSYDPDATGYPISQSAGSYQYTGINGKPYNVDTSTNTEVPVMSSYPETTQSSTVVDGSTLFGSGPTVPTSTKASDTAGGGNYPWPTASGPISSTYGNRERVGKMCHKDDIGTGDAVQHCGVHMHNGLDIAVASGTEVNSMTEGKVVWVSPACKGGPEGEAGCTVSIMKPDGEMSTYMHLKGTKPGLNVGDSVSQGESFAYSGNSGTATTAAHLHLEMCQVPPNKANGKTSPLALCNMGERINPLSKLSSSDPRYKTACAMSSRSPLNANIKGPCAYKKKTKKNKNQTSSQTVTPVDTRQSTVAKGVY